MYVKFVEVKSALLQLMGTTFCFMLLLLLCCLVGCEGSIKAVHGGQVELLGKLRSERPDKIV